MNEHFLRFLGKRYPRDYSKLPAALYWTLHLVWLVPLESVSAGGGEDCVESGEATRDSAQAERGSGVILLRGRGCCAGFWAGVVLIFFALSTNQEYYTFPAYLPLLLLLADGVAQCERAECDRGVRAGWLTTSAGLLAVIGVAASAMLVVGLWQSRNLPFEPDIGECAGQAGSESVHAFDVAHAGP